MKIDFTGRKVLVTGGSRGLGREMALSFAEAGARVAVSARSSPQLTETVERLNEIVPGCVGFAGDLTDPAACVSVVADAARSLGGLDTLIANASSNVDSTPSAVDEIGDADLLARITGKALSAMRCIREALPSLRLDRGRVVLIGGTSAGSVFRGDELPTQASSQLLAGPGNALLSNYSKQLSELTAADGVLVNIVHPHMMKTDRHPARLEARAARMGVSIDEASRSFDEQIPIGRVLDPADVVPIVLFLAAPLNTAITGQSVVVDGGASRVVRL